MFTIKLVVTGKNYIYAWSKVMGNARDMSFNYIVEPHSFAAVVNFIQK